jgi:allantoate deiminase
VTRKFDIGARAKARCDLLGVSPYSEVDGQLTRRFLTPAHEAALQALTLWITSAGMTARRDAAGSSDRPL